MARRATSHFACQECGAQSPGWLGRCPDCGAWDSLVEEIDAADRGGRVRRSIAPEPIRLGAIAEDTLGRLATGMPVLDRVLGGGMVPGSAILLAGEPGIGKSTLLLHLADGLGKAGHRVLYLSAEESGRQLRLRADRLGCEAAELRVVADTALEPVLDLLDEGGFAVALVDSVQAVKSDELESPPGSISQVRQVAHQLVQKGKQGEVAVILVGHITKEGAIAGPKSLEHLVDTVLSFEGDGSGEFRILRATKNRFGPAGEVAMFEMHDTGLVPVTDPSRVLVSQRRAEAAGSAVTASLQGLRPLLVEVQALVHTTNFPAPRRMAVGCDANRLVLLVAVLERFGDVSFADKDIFVNAVGGLALREPAADLAICVALLSALMDQPLPPNSVFFGEVGLLGEVRPVSRVDARLAEASHLGYETAWAPADSGTARAKAIAVRPIADVTELVARIRNSPDS